MVGANRKNEDVAGCWCALFRTIRVGGATIARFLLAFSCSMFRGKSMKQCPSCGALLPPLRRYIGAVASNGGDSSLTALSPSRVVVMHKTSRLEFERRKHKHLSERQLQTEVSVDELTYPYLCLQTFRACAVRRISFYQLSRRLGADYDVLHQRHSTQKRNLEEIDRFLG